MIFISEMRKLSPKEVKGPQPEQFEPGCVRIQNLVFFSLWGRSKVAGGDPPLDPGDFQARALHCRLFVQMP